MRRQPPPRRGPSLMGTMARTAVIAGTATAVSGNVAQKQHAKANVAQQQQAAQQAAAQTQTDVEQMQQQLAALQMQQAQATITPVAPAAPAPAAGGDLITQLKQLADLKAAGILNDAEFEAAKAPDRKSVV